MPTSRMQYRVTVIAAPVLLAIATYGCGGASGYTTTTGDATTDGKGTAIATAEAAATSTVIQTAQIQATSGTSNALPIPTQTITSVSTGSPQTPTTVSTTTQTTSTDQTSTQTSATTAPSTQINSVTSIAPTNSAISANSPLPLVTSTDLTYQGAFRFPDIPYNGNVCDGLTYAARGVAFDPEGNSGKGSLFVTGHVRCGARVAEVSIPTAVVSTNLTQLPRSEMLQVKPNTLIDPLEGKLATSGITGGTNTTVNGLMVYQGKLIISAGNDYTYDPTGAHWSRPRDLSLTGQVSDQYTVVGDKGYTSARLTSGYMCDVPTEFQNILGGPALTGWVAQSIVSAASDGPAAFAFDPAKLRSGINMAGTILAYPDGNNLQKSIPGQTQNIWNWTSMTSGCVIPNGTRSILFFGSHGIGEFQYGVGGAAGHTNTTPQIAIYDPSDNSTGEHAWPYRYQVWAYDVNELAKVRSGDLKPYEPKPYAVWRFTIPFENQNDRHYAGGIAYNQKLKQLYFVQQNAGPYGEPIVHVFTINNAISN